MRFARRSRRLSEVWDKHACKWCRALDSPSWRKASAIIRNLSLPGLVHSQPPTLYSSPISITVTFPPKLEPTDAVIALWHLKADLVTSGPAREAAIPVVARALGSGKPLEKACAACLSVTERIEETLSDAEEHLISILDDDCDLDGVTMLQLLEAMQFNERLRTHSTSQRLIETLSKSDQTGHQLATRLLAKYVD